MYALHEESSGAVKASMEKVFARLDDHTRLSAHMNRRSWKMGWGTMETVLDEGQGKKVGSHIGLRGRAFGVTLYVDEIVVTRDPPRRKSWETVGSPQLLIIGAYRMSIELSDAEPQQTLLTVRIDYDLLPGLLGQLLGRTYARWCVRQMLHDAQRAFV